MFSKLIAALLLLLIASQAMGDEIRVAVASNFTEAIKMISSRFESATGHKVTLISGATGRHYAQLKNGAPFHAFFSADERRPQLLEQEGQIVPGSRFTYALGKVILWSPRPNYIDPRLRVLEEQTFHHLAIANPKLAPYGKAAQEILATNKAWKTPRGKIVRGENIGQTFQFVQSGNAQLGFVAYSQVKRPGQAMQGSWWDVPQNLYSPIEQQAVLIKDNAVARDFLAFIKQNESLEIIRGFGYGIP